MGSDVSTGQLLPSGSPVCSAQCAGTVGRRRGLTCSRGNAQEPAGVFQSSPEHLWLHGTSSKCRVPARQAAEVLAWDALGGSCAVGVCRCGLGTPVPQALPFQTSLGHLGLAKVWIGLTFLAWLLVSLSGTQINHYLVRMSPLLCTTRPWPAAPAAPAVGRRSGRLGLGWRQAAWSWLLTVSGWEEGACRGASPGPSLLGSSKTVTPGPESQCLEVTGCMQISVCVRVGEENLSLNYQHKRLLK